MQVHAAAARWQAPARRPTIPLSMRDEGCPHVSAQTGKRCEAKSRKFWSHLESPHQDCTDDCRGCSLVLQGEKRRRLLPTAYQPSPSVQWLPVYDPPIPWKKLFSASLPPYEELSAAAKKQRHKMALQLLGLNYRTEDLPTVISDLLQWADLEPDPEPEPTALTDLLVFCEELKLADNKLRFLLKLLKTDFTVKDIKAHRKELLSEVPIRKPADRKGAYTVDLQYLLRVLIETKQARLSCGEDKSPLLLLKLNIDGGRVFLGNGPEAYMTLGSLEDADRGEAKFKSRKSAYLFYAQSGGESHKKLAELTELWQLVERLHRGEKILHNGRYWEIKIVVAVDLPAGRKIFGFAAFYAPQMKDCKCCWCGISKAMLGCFDRLWPMRQFHQLVIDGQRAEQTGTTVGGMQHAPLVRDFSLICLIPCALHILINVTKKLMAMTVARIETRPDLVPEFEALFGRIGVWLAPAVDPKDEDKAVLKVRAKNGGQQKLLSERWAKSSPNAVSAQKILNHADEYGTLLSRASSHEAKAAMYRKLWNKTAELLRVVTAYTPTAAEIAGFELESRKWGMLYVDCFSSNDVTTYIHVLGCHVHQFLTQYGSIGKFGNWAAEGLHSEVKYTVLNHSPRSGGRGQDAPAFHALLDHVLRRRLELLRSGGQDDLK